MSSYFEFNDRIAFHPGYYIKELIDESGLSQQDFAYRLGTTPKNLSILVRGDQSLSIDIAMKLSRMLGTSVDYWLNLQKSYDALIAEFESTRELEQEKRVFAYLEYAYFEKFFGLTETSQNTEDQIKRLREFLRVSSLSVFTKPGMTTSFGKAIDFMEESDVTKANAMVQIAINKALQSEAPKYNKHKFERAVDYALTLTSSSNDIFPLLEKSFAEAGVIIEMIPDLPGSNISSATKKIGQHVMLMLNNRIANSDAFWPALHHEIHNIQNGEFGITFDKSMDRIVS